jgi:hypothetical protein
MYNLDLLTKETKMQSNSKLTATQKIILRDMLDEAMADNIVVENLDNITTMAYQDCGDTVKFSLCVMSADEKKFRAKVGQYHALDRFFTNQLVTMRRIDFQIMCENVWDIWGL